MDDIVKLVKQMFAEINRLCTLADVKVIGINPIPADNRINKGERELQLTFDAKLDRDLHRLAEGFTLSRFTIQSDSRTFAVDDNKAFFKGYEFMTDEVQTFTIAISALRDAKEHDGYMRLVVPITKNYWVHNLSTASFKTENTWYGGLMRLAFPNGEVQVFMVKDGASNQQYMAIEPQYVVSRDELFNIHYAVATGLGIITGTAAFGEAYVMVSESLDFQTYEAVSYYSMRESVHSQYATFTTNMYWLEMVLRQGANNQYALDMIRDEKGEVKRGFVDWLYPEVYSELIVNMFRYPEFARAAFILMDGSQNALDYQAAMYAVALETLCTKLKEIYKIEYGGIIDNKNGDWTRIRKTMTKAFREACEAREIDGKTVERIEGRIPNLNDISNADKFNIVLDRLGLNRIQSDIDAISQRNNLLHGNLVSKTAEGSTDFDDMYYYSLVLHRLCTSIIFKFAGYKGHLVNNAVLMDRKVACDRREPVLIEI